MSAKQVAAKAASKNATAKGKLRTAAAKKPAARKQSKSRVASKLKNSGLQAARSQSKSKQANAKTQPLGPAEVSHRIHALLHTIHQIERYEERLCSMEEAIRRTGRLNAPLLRDLQALLEDMPTNEYQHDLDAVRDAVAA